MTNATATEKKTGFDWVVIERVPAGPCQAAEVVRENHGVDHVSAYYRASALGPRFARTCVLASLHIEPGMEVR